jgi:hypothetical protein
MARVPRKMKEELVTKKTKCACCSAFASFVLSSWHVHWPLPKFTEVVPLLIYGT